MDMQTLAAQIRALQNRMDTISGLQANAAVLFTDTAIPVDNSFHTLTDMDVPVADLGHYVVEALVFYTPGGSVGTPTFMITGTSTGLSRLAFQGYIQGTSDSENIYRVGDFGGGFVARQNENAVPSFALMRGWFKASGNQTLHLQVSGGAGNSAISVKDASYMMARLVL